MSTDGFKAPRYDWPRLTETLTGIRHPFRCQRCSIAVDDEIRLSPRLKRTVWQEHDRFDKPEPGRYVVLCQPCATEIIDPHPRLYRRLQLHEPAAGAIEICNNCPHRDGARCASPKAAFNGGEGIVITGPKPSQVHVQRAGPGGRGRRCSWEHLYPGPATDCTGKEVTG